jgi:Beta-lactamase superfamily domain
VSRPRRPRFALLGIGAAASPRFPPAGLLVEHRGVRVAIDGGPGAEAEGPLDAWLVTDERAELMPAIRRKARDLGLTAGARPFQADDLQIEPHLVIHTSHPAFGYRIRAVGRTVVWAPEFLRFPDWAAGCDLMFAEAAAWSRPIRFAGGVGGHAPLLEVADAARASDVRRLVFAHIGRPTIRALDRGERPPFGEIGVVGGVYRP